MDEIDELSECADLEEMLEVAYTLGDKEDKEGE